MRLLYIVPLRQTDNGVIAVVFIQVYDIILPLLRLLLYNLQPVRDVATLILLLNDVLPLVALGVLAKFALALNSQVVILAPASAHEAVILFVEALVFSEGFF